jgi:outer membrane receptor protein involved in Fe transport
LDGSGTETPGFLPGQPEDVYNASLYYSDRRLDVNLSWNRTASYVAGFFADAPQNDIYLLGRDVFSAKISYGVSDAIRFFVEGNNLFSEDLIEVSGPPELKNFRRRYNFGRTISVGGMLNF